MTKKKSARTSDKGAAKTNRGSQSSDSGSRVADKNAQGESQPPEQPTPKTKFSKEVLDEFRQLLLTKRAELIGDVDHMTNEALRNSQPGGVGSLSKEQEFTLDLVANERQCLKEIDAALQRIADHTYGICESTHKPIGKKRLRAKPWARYCIESAREKELGGTP